MQADVLVIGAGPAGAAAARRCAEQGLVVVLLEKCRLPRQKACGGAVPALIRKHIPFDLDRCCEHRVNILRYRFDNQREKIHRYENTVLYMVDRLKFDHRLVESALGQHPGSVILKDAFSVTSFEETAKTVCATGPGGETITAGFAIGADGARGVVSHSLGFKSRRQSVIAVAADIDVSSAEFERFHKKAAFDMGCISNGYGWIFPKNGYLSCGVGAWNTPSGKYLISRLRRFLRQNLTDESFRTIRRRLHPVPIYEGHRRIASARTCLAGDAARLVDPITGEGIGYAIQSGELAADVVANLAAQENSEGKGRERKGGKGGCIRYQRQIHAGMGKEMHLLFRYALPVFLDAPEFFYRRFYEKGCSYQRYFKNVEHILASHKGVGISGS